MELLPENPKAKLSGRRKDCARVLPLPGRGIESARGAQGATGGAHVTAQVHDLPQLGRRPSTSAPSYFSSSDGAPLSKHLSKHLLDRHCDSASGGGEGGGGGGGSASTRSTSLFSPSESVLGGGGRTDRGDRRSKFVLYKVSGPSGLLERKKEGERERGREGEGERERERDFLARGSSRSLSLSSSPWQKGFSGQGRSQEEGADGADGGRERWGRRGGGTEVAAGLGKGTGTSKGFVTCMSEDTVMSRTESPWRQDENECFGALVLSRHGPKPKPCLNSAYTQALPKP